MSYVQRSKIQKMSIVKKSNSWSRKEVHKKDNNFDTMRFTHNDVNFKVKYESHQNWSKTYFKDF